MRLSYLVNTFFPIVKGLGGVYARAFNLHPSLKFYSYETSLHGLHRSISVFHRARKRPKELIVMLQADAAGISLMA